MEKKSKFLCPVCNLRFNKKAREPIFMLCCSKTACKKCVLTEMSKINSGQPIEEVEEISGSFQCRLCDT